MSFDNPRFLFFLIPLVLFIPAIVMRYRKDRKAVVLFAAVAPSGERESLFRELRLRIIISDVFFLLFAAFLIIALAGPRWGLRIVADYRRGVDMVLAFDLSRSMNVRDCPSYSAGRSPGQGAISRLERGKEIAREFGASLGDIRAGVAIGKGRGILAVPLTYDSETLLSFLHSLDSLALTGRGTNLESLVDAASGAFQDSVPSRRGIILFSDGETLSGSFQSALEKLRKAGITLCVVGLGSDEGGPVPVETGPDAPDGMLLGADRKPVISSRQDDVLRNGAEQSGGIYVDGSLGGAAPVLARYVNSLSAESRLSGYRREANPRWRIFVLAAMACLGGSRIMGYSRRSRKRNHAAGRAEHSSRRPVKKEQAGGKSKALPILLCLTLFLFSSCVKTNGKLLIMEGNFFHSRHFYTEAISSYLKALNYEDSSPYAEYGLASAYFSLEEGDAALERYKAAEKKLLELEQEDHSELKYRIHYNSGIIYFEKGEYLDAANAFREALKIDSGRIEAKRNLELSLLTIDRTGSPQSAPSGRTESAREGRGGSGSVLMEYLRQKEQEQWKSREWNEESDSTGPDY